MTTAAPRYLALLAAAGCSDTQEAVTVELPVAVAAAPLPAATTDLGYTVEVARLRVAVARVQFTIAGEQHDVAARVGPRPHPGHSAGGEVTGELPGEHVLVWDGAARPALGTGRLIAGAYRGANFALREAGGADELPAGDPLLGHTFHVEGTAARAGTTTPFDAVLDVAPGTEVIGAVFEHAVTAASTETLALTFHPTDPSEGDTAFDGIDFFALPAAAGVLEIRPGSAAHNILRRVLQTHDHYAVVPTDD